MKKKWSKSWKKFTTHHLSFFKSAKKFPFSGGFEEKNARKSWSIRTLGDPAQNPGRPDSVAITSKMTSKSTIGRRIRPLGPPVLSCRIRSGRSSWGRQTTLSRGPGPRVGTPTWRVGVTLLRPVPGFWMGRHRVANSDARSKPMAQEPCHPRIFAVVPIAAICISSRGLTREGASPGRDPDRTSTTIESVDDVSASWDTILVLSR
jgi:hypothetical protein